MMTSGDGQLFGGRVQISHVGRVSRRRVFLAAERSDGATTGAVAQI